MFRISKSLEVWWPATIREPADGGQLQEFEIELRLIVPRQSTIRAMRKAAKVSSEAALEAENNWITKHVVGWKGVHGEDGQALDFSQERLLDLLDHPGGRLAVARAMLHAAEGVEEAAKKTLPKSRPVGPAAARKTKPS